MRSGLSKSLIGRLLGDVKYTPNQLEEMYPKRELLDGAMVTRFAPSPTGFLHLGSLNMLMINERLAHQSNGVFFIRIEDTDTKRSVAGSIDVILEVESRFGLKIDEGPKLGGGEHGNYGPYTQSHRVEIYKTYVADLLERGLAYPCFMAEDDIEKITSIQTKSGLRPGFYGEYARDRNLAEDEIITRLDAGKKPIFRLYSTGNYDEKIYCKDALRGSIAFPQNDTDIVILKSDGLPTYHFAHLVDDHLMRTTHVVRGGEWLSSMPLHVSLFQMMGWDVPVYAHLGTIDKMDGESRRKISKRHDPEASIALMLEQGFAPQAILEYLFNIAASGYEDAKLKNSSINMWSYPINLKKMSPSGALFDMKKLESISREWIATLSINDLFASVYEFAMKYDADWSERIAKSPDYLKNMLAIERDNPKRIRKDFVTWRQTLDEVSYFYDDLFKLTKSKFESEFNGLNHEVIISVLSEFRDNYDDALDASDWFNGVRDLGERFGFAKNQKEYDAAPDKYIGTVSDVASFLRVAITGRKMTPDLYSIMQVMGKSRVIDRLNNIING